MEVISTDRRSAANNSAGPARLCRQTATMVNRMKLLMVRCNALLGGVLFAPLFGQTHG
jgi:hypothetical protein